MWNEEFDFEIRHKALVQNSIRITLYNNDERRGTPVEIGFEEFSFPLFFYNGHGIKDHFYVFKNDLAVGKILLHTSFEPYPPEPERVPTPPLAPKDSLLMDDMESVKKKKKKRIVKKKPAGPKPDWNGRFWVDGVANLDRTHPYYKVYFDSPHRGASIDHASTGRGSSRLFVGREESRFLKENSKSQSQSPKMSTLGQSIER